MNPFRNTSLLIKIILVVTAIVLSFFGFATFIDYRLHREFIIGESVEKARLISSEAIRAREYISNQLQVGKIQLSEDRYGLIPVVASARIGALVAEDLDYMIRQVSDRYRNPENAPDAFETRILGEFRENPYLREQFAVTKFNGEPAFRYLQPFTVEASCLECHGDPATAPDYIKRLFPEEYDQAYNYQIGEIIGAASVIIPMDNLYRQISRNVWNDLFYSSGVFLALILCLGILSRVAVTGPLDQLGAAIRNIVHSGRYEKIPRKSRDEIGKLIMGFNEMIDHLQEKTQHLEESERRFRTLTETARDGIISFLANGQIILFNRQAERIFGYSKTEVIGESVSRLIHEDCTSLQEIATGEYLEKHQERLLRKIHRITGRRRDGEPLFLELSLSVADSDGHFFYTAILRDRSPGSENESVE